MSVTIHVGDCREVLAGLPEAFADSIVSDAPYEYGFMGKDWDSSGVAFDLATWRAALRVAKPGAHLAVFGGTRTFHRLMCAIEDAGWEIRDTLMWVYGSGFPKSKNLDGDWEGWGTALKPAWEPIILARKPFKGSVASNVACHGTGAINIDGCRVPSHDQPIPFAKPSQAEGWRLNKRQQEWSPSDIGRWPANLIHDGSEEVMDAFPLAGGQQAEISGTAPSNKTGTVYGYMRRNGEASADSENSGSVGFKMRPGMRRIDSGSAARFFYCAKATREDRDDGCDDLPLRQGGMVSNTSGQHLTRRDGGAPGAVRNNHPTVKPTPLMRWLCRLVTPPGGVIVDPFLGSGSTGRGAVAEGFGIVGIELEAVHVDIAKCRIAAVQPGLPFGSVA